MVEVLIRIRSVRAEQMTHDQWQLGVDIDTAFNQGTSSAADIGGRDTATDAFLPFHHSEYEFIS
jgi:hypothetical protein